MKLNINVKKLSRRMKAGVYGMAVTAVIIALVIFVNLFVSSLPVSLIHFNTQSINYSEVGEESRKVLDSLSEDVILYYVVERGSEDGRIEELLANYNELSSKITVKNVDPIEDPAFLSKYASENLTRNSILAVSPKRVLGVSSSDMFGYYLVYEGEEVEISADHYLQFMNTEYSSYLDVRFEAEYAITSAVEYVSRESVPKVYLLNGHGETFLDNSYTSTLDAENIEVDKLPLLGADKVPDDCDTVIINIPTKDLTADEKTKLESYLDRGGNIVFITDYQFTAEKFPNFAALAEREGLKANEGIISESSNLLMQNPYYFLPSVVSSDSSVTSKLSSTNINVAVGNAHGIITVDGNSNSFTTILRSSAKAVIKEVTEDGIKDRDDYEGNVTIPVGVVSEKSILGDTVDGKSAFVWYSSSAIADSSWISYIGSGNLELFMASIKYLCHKEVNLSIIGKSTMVEPLVLTDSERGFWTFAMTVAVPVIILGAGFAVWFRRRRK